MFFCGVKYCKRRLCYMHCVQLIYQLWTLDISVIWCSYQSVQRQDFLSLKKRPGLGPQIWVELDRHGHTNVLRQISILIQWSLLRFPPPVSLFCLTSFCVSFICSGSSQIIFCDRITSFARTWSCFPVSRWPECRGSSGIVWLARTPSGSLYSVERSRATPLQSARGR